MEIILVLIFLCQTLVQSWVFPERSYLRLSEGYYSGWYWIFVYSKYGHDGESSAARALETTWNIIDMPMQFTYDLDTKQIYTEYQNKKYCVDCDGFDKGCYVHLYPCKTRGDDLSHLKNQQWALVEKEKQWFVIRSELHTNQYIAKVEYENCFKLSDTMTYFYNAS